MASSTALAPISTSLKRDLYVGHPTMADDRERIEAELRFVLGHGDASPVHRCMEYATLGAGQRIRPMLAVRMGRLCQAPADLVLRGAVATELIHCASLIVDDLPCMDNEQMRRGRPSAHVAFGEPTALLAAFGLVAMAARSILEQPALERYCATQRRLASAVLKTLDCASLIGGQSLDLELTGARRDSKRAQMNELKTTPLFLLAVEAGTAYAEAPSYPLLRRFGREFGNAFQLTDDYLDGELADRAVLDRQFEAARGWIEPFGAPAQPLSELIDYLNVRSQEKDRSHR